MKSVLKMTIVGLILGLGLEKSVATTGLAKAGDGAAVTRPGLSWDLDRIDQAELPLDGSFRSLYTGKGVRVYVFDTGIDSLETDLVGRVRLGFDAFSGKTGEVTHGTAVAALAAGTRAGVAKNAQVISVRVALNSQDALSMTILEEGLAWVLKDLETYAGRAVINWSFVGGGEGMKYPGIESLAQKLRQKGVLIVEAAGNTYIDACVHPTVLLPETFVVGASKVVEKSGWFGRKGTTTDYVSSFSGFGKCVDMYAPGEDNVVPVGNGWMKISGTSFAAPLVSGAVALLLEENKELSVADIETTLKARATSGSLKDVKDGNLILRVR